MHAISVINALNQYYGLIMTSSFIYMHKQVKILAIARLAQINIHGVRTLSVGACTFSGN
jgi:hypothetical protein